MCKFPKGKAGFKTIRKENYVYIDKTRYIELLENTHEQAILFLRPRRFGKTLFISMLDSYYDINSESEFETLFKGTYIYEHPTDLHNQYYVLRFDFSGLNTQTPDILMSDFHEQIYQTCTEFLGRYHFDIRLNKGTSAASCFNGFISKMRVHLPKDKKIYTIIDEYDHYANELLSFDFDSFGNILSKHVYIRKFYEVLKKGTLGVIAQIFITGVSPITLDSITSGFNISTNLTNDPRLNDMLGFTSKDMEYLISLVDCIKNPEDILTKMKQYYDGYLFSKNGVNHMFNPNMALYYLDYYQSFSREPEELVDPNIYSDYAKLESLLRIKPNTAHQQVIADVLSNREVICRLTTTYTINNNHDEENDFSLDDFISLLFYLGYLTISGSKGVRVYLKVPNEVIKNVYFDYFRAMLDNKDENAAKDMVKKYIWQIN